MASCGAIHPPVWRRRAPAPSAVTQRWVRGGTTRAAFWTSAAAVVVAGAGHRGSRLERGAPAAILLAGRPACGGPLPPDGVEEGWGRNAGHGEAGGQLAGRSPAPSGYNPPMADRIRVAALQYFIRPVRTFQEFREQVEGLVETARDYKTQLLVFPEYFSVQLLTLGDLRRPIHVQVRGLADQVGPFVELMSSLAKKSGIYIVAGTIPTRGDGDEVHNDCYVFSPCGGSGVQGKLHMTRWEREEWFVSPRQLMRVFETDFGRMAVAICYDAEFPELARAAAREGCYVLVVPSCTDERQGFLRVRYCAHARAIENQMFVVHAVTVGSLPMVPAVSLNYGQAAILTPSDFPFARDGILAEGNPNLEMMVIGELNLETIRDSRESGTVLPLRDSMSAAEVGSTLETVKL
jgi:predicted amidohydrolase